jgi:hypothetical protein
LLCQALYHRTTSSLCHQSSQEAEWELPHLPYFSFVVVGKGGEDLEITKRTN